MQQKKLLRNLRFRQLNQIPKKVMQGSLSLLFLSILYPRLDAYEVAKERKIMEGLDGEVLTNNVLGARDTYEIKTRHGFKLK
jgi:hypothetical protein